MFQIVPDTSVSFIRVLCMNLLDFLASRALSVSRSLIFPDSQA